MSNRKKPFSPPELVEFGSVYALTQGMFVSGNDVTGMQKRKKVGVGGDAAPGGGDDSGSTGGSSSGSED